MVYLCAFSVIKSINLLSLSNHLNCVALRHKPNLFLSDKWLSRPTRPLVKRWNIYYSNTDNFVVTCHKFVIDLRVYWWFTFVAK